MDFSPEKLKSLTKWFIGVACGLILFFLGLHNLDRVLSFISRAISLIMPLLLGFGFAIILNVPLKFFERHLFPRSKKPFLTSIRRPVAFIISLIVIFGIIIGIVFLVVPELSHAVQVIAQSIMDIARTLGSMSAEEFEALPFGSFLLDMDWNKILDSAESWLKNQSGDIVDKAFDTIGSLIGGVFDFFISFVFAIYILFGKDKLKKQAVRIINAWLPKKFGTWLIHASYVASVNLRNFISGQFIEAIIIGVLCFIGMVILKLPYALMISVIVGVTALIPVVGAFIGTIVGCFTILTVDPLKAVIFLIFLLILQQLEGNLIYPRVMGSRVNLPGMWILAAVTVGGALAGPAGMLLSVPFAATVFMLFKEATEKRELLLACESAVTVTDSQADVQTSNEDENTSDEQA